MKEILEKKKCTACTACVNICPKNAIKMIEFEDGFKYPTIDQNKCTDCKLCQTVCPVLNKHKNNITNKCYVAYNKNEDILLKSSSGGIFSALADYILNNEKGLIIGAAFDEDNNLIHIAVDNNKDLNKLQGSKYLQSDLNKIFQYIKINLKNKKVLFVGTPCQVSGLKSFLKKEYKNLICVDLFCHGVPSPKLFKKYIKELEKQKDQKLERYNFRDKCTGWETYSNTAEFKEVKDTQLSKDNTYMKLFLSDIALRESCYNCNFKIGNKYSDITLGDFWGIQKYYPEMYNNKGVSAIIVNTEKGQDILNKIQNQINIKQCKLTEIIDQNPFVQISAEYPRKRTQFFTELDSLSIEELSQKYKKKISLLTRILNKIKKYLRR